MKLTHLPIIGSLFNGIPGPFLAKISVLWSLYQLLRGCYRERVRELHRRYGPIVQVAPQHYSLSGKQLVYVPKLMASLSLLDRAAYDALVRALDMEGLFRRESQIDECNRRLVALLPDRIGQRPGQVEELGSLVTRYAWEVLLTITTRQSVGFLEPEVEAANIYKALKNWKFYSILYGSYLRHHPYIMQILKLFTGRDHLMQREDVEARIALCLAAADPAITLINTALQRVYGDNHNLLNDLRDELSQAEITQPLNFKNLILLRPRMPLLYGVLQECARTAPPTVIGPTFLVPNGGVNVAGRWVEGGTLISIEQLTAHVNQAQFGENASCWGIEKWLDQTLAASMKQQLLAFNLSAGNNVETFQILLAAKLLAHSIVSSDIRPSTAPDISKSGENPALTNGAITHVTLTAADTLTTWLSKGDAEALLTGRLAPHHRNYDREEPIFTAPISQGYTRALIHNAINVTHSGRLQHLTHPYTHAMCIGPRCQVPRDYQRTKHKGHRYSQVRKQQTSAQKPLPPPTDPRTTTWAKWAEEEGSRKDYLKTAEAYGERQAALEREVSRQKENDATTEYIFKETFKQTSGESASDKSSDVSEATFAEADSNTDGFVTAEDFSKAIPPHLRRRNQAHSPKAVQG